LLKPEEWKALWIGAPWQKEAALPKPARTGQGEVPGKQELPPPAPMLRKSFIINKEIASARAFVTGLGYFELYLNGKKVSEDVLVPTSLHMENVRDWKKTIFLYPTISGNTG